MDIVPDLKAARILVVEDDLPVADRIVNTLRRAGYYVQNAYNSGDALAADHAHFDLALVYGAMRDREGVSILDRIERHPSFARLPILTVHDGGAPPHPGSRTLRRSFSDAELLAQVDQLLADRKPRTPPQPAHPALGAHLDQQLAELKTLSHLGRSISSVLDLSEVLNQIVEAATTLTNAEEGLLLLPDEEGRALYIRAMKGVDDASAGNFRIKTEDALVGRVYKSGEPILIGDKGLQRVKTEYFVRSLLYVPMTYKGQMIGVLGVNNRVADRAFSPHDQELLTDLAAHAAIAIENARLYEERLLQNRQLTTLVDAGKAVNSKLALNEVLLTIGQQIIQALNVHACLIDQYDEASGTLRPLASTRCAVWRSEQGPVCILEDRPVLNRALKENAFYVVERDDQSTKWLGERDYLYRENAQHMIMLPVRSANQPPIGALELYYSELAPEVTGEFRAQVRALALETLALIFQKASTPPVSLILSNVRKILDRTHANSLYLSLLPGSKQLVRVVEYGAVVFLDEPYPQRMIFPADMTIFEDHPSLNYQARQADLPDAVRSAMTTYGAAAMLCLPLVIKGKPFGTVTIYDTLEARHFQPQESSLASALMAQAAAAIENARLYRDLEQSLTELKQTQASLVQAARLSTMGELAAVVAHQINNPLTTVMVDAEIMLQDMAPQNPLYEGLTAIYRSGQRAHAVVKRLLSMVRRREPGDPLQWVAVHDTLHHTLDLVTTHIERNKVKLRIELDESQPAYVQAPPGHLEDLWLNLLLNARDALVNMPGATIGVRTRRSGDQLEVSIWDNGPGIQPEHVEHLFEAFFTTKPAGEGTGLGLYICRQIVDQCQGTIQVETAPGKGTCFWITLPVQSKDSLEEN